MTVHKATLLSKEKAKTPIQVVAGERFRTKKKAEKESRERNKAYKDSEVKFMVVKKAGEENDGTLNTSLIFVNGK